ncbi:unnamed protein product, partial [Tetraodon nigroviridis]
ESCDSLCSCVVKDGILYLNCEQRNISKISQIKIPPGVPFHLNLYKNDLVELLAEEMKELKNALSLHIGGNSIQELEPGIFSTLGSLKKLHINSNFLITLREDTFQGLVNLEFLQADTNFIRVIEPGAFNKLIRLKVLILNDNSIGVSTQQHLQICAPNPPGPARKQVTDTALHRISGAHRTDHGTPPGRQQLGLRLRYFTSENLDGKYEGPVCHRGCGLQHAATP